MVLTIAPSAPDDDNGHLREVLYLATEAARINRQAEAAEIANEDQRDIALRHVLGADADYVLEVLAAAVSRSTRACYQKAFRSWSRYCDEHGWPVWPVQAKGSHDQFVYRILQWLAQEDRKGYAYTTMQTRIAGLKWAAKRDNIWFATAVLSNAPLLDQFMKGAAYRRRDEQTKQAPAFTIDDLVDMHTGLSTRPTPTKLRDRGIIALGVAGAMRSRNIVELNLGDISHGLTIDGYRIRLRWSKTDQVGKGREIAVLRVRNRTIDPVHALDEWLSFLKSQGYTPEETPLAPLFPRGGNNHLRYGVRIHNSSSAVIDVVRKAAAIADLPNPARFTSHSLRATFVTLAYAAGVPESRIAAITGHKKIDILRQYDRTEIERMGQTDYLGG